MLATIGSAIGLFAATNIDDIVVLTVLFLASSRGKPRPWQIVAGQYLGFITLVVISVIAALGLTIVPDEWVGFLGLIPLGIGIWTLIRGLRRNGDDAGVEVPLGEWAGRRFKAGDPDMAHGPDADSGEHAQGMAP